MNGPGPKHAVVHGPAEAGQRSAAFVSSLPDRRPIPGRPDLPAMLADDGPAPSSSAGRAIDDIDLARASEYALLAALLARAPDADFLARLARVRGDASPLGLAHAALADAAAAAEAADVEREYFDLFVGVGRGELLPYASYYLTGFLNERPLARLREDLHALGIARAEGQCEPEDHAAILCEIMAGFADGRLAAPAEAQQRMFERHLAPWIGRFFADLEGAGAARFYRKVGALGRVFTEIETQGFALPA